MKFAFIGLGKMGGGLCKHLLAGGGRVRVYDIVPAAVEKFVQLGAEAARDAKDAAADADAVITSLPLPTDLENLLLGDAGIFTAMKKGATLIDISTIDPGSARRFTQSAEERGLFFLACPLGKGPAQADAGEAPIFAGGRKEIYEKFKGWLEKMGKPVFYLGDVEQSTAFKLITNLIGMTNVLVMAEGVRLSQKMRIDKEVFLEACRETGAFSYQMQVRAPWLYAEDFTPRFSVKLAHKDVRLGVEMARSVQQACPNFTSALASFAEAIAQGFGDEDCLAAVKVLK